MIHIDGTGYAPRLYMVRTLRKSAYNTRILSVYTERIRGNSADFPMNTVTVLVHIITEVRIRSMQTLTAIGGYSVDPK